MTSAIRRPVMHYPNASRAFRLTSSRRCQPSQLQAPRPALGSLDEPTGPEREHETDMSFPAVLFARAPVVGLEFFELGTDRKLTALVRHDDPIQFSRLGRGEARATHTGGIDRPTAACGFHHPSNLTVLLPSDITLSRHGDSGLVIAAQVCTRRPRSPDALWDTRMPDGVRERRVR